MNVTDKFINDFSYDKNLFLNHIKHIAVNNNPNRKNATHYLNYPCSVAFSFNKGKRRK